MYLQEHRPKRRCDATFDSLSVSDLLLRTHPSFPSVQVSEFQTPSQISDMFVTIKESRQVN